MVVTAAAKPVVGSSFVDILRQRRCEFVRVEAEEPVDVRPGIHKGEMVESGVRIGSDLLQVALHIGP